MKRYLSKLAVAKYAYRSSIVALLIVGSTTSHASTFANSVTPDFDIGGSVTVTKVTDGDSLRSGKLKIRLFGIDAPEIKQNCTSATGESWACGFAAKTAIGDMLGADSILQCHLRDVDRYGRLVMQCFNQEQDIARALVKAGLALSYRQYSDLYVREEEQAQAAGVGMWQGAFLPPWQWRKNN